MNKFDLIFFQKYIPEGQELMSVIHTHPIQILKILLVQVCLIVLLPSFFFYYSHILQDIIPFYIFEIFLIGAFIRIVYDIFDWYNDVWIITTGGVISLQRSFLKAKSDTLTYDNIEGVGVEQDGFLDKILKKGDLVVHKIGDDSFVLTDAINPFHAVDILEEMSQEEEEDIEDDKFDMIMDALGGVVGDYLEKKDKPKTDKQQQLEEVIEKVENHSSTIDLR